MKLCPYFQKECLGEECIGAAHLGGLKWTCKPLGNIDISTYIKTKKAKKEKVEGPIKPNTSPNKD